MDHNDTLTPGAEAFCAINQADHIQAMANYCYVHELTHDLRSHSGTNSEIKGTVH